MFFAAFNKGSFRPYFRLLSFALIVFYVITSNGCETTYTERYTSENLKKKSKLEGIAHIILKDGTYINTQDRQVFYYEKYADTTNVIIITMGDTAIATIVNGKQKLVVKTIEKIIPISQVNEVYVERKEFDTGKTLLLVGGIVVALAVIFVASVFIYLASHPIHSCPYIYSFDGANYIYDAEPLGGVICEALARTDVSRLEHLTVSDGKFKLFVKNENDEQQRLDEMKLLLINHEEGQSVTSDLQNKFFKYRKINPPESVLDESGTDITKYFSEKDEFRWQTDLIKMYDGSVSGKHSLKFRFKKPEGVKSALLFVNGGISNWGSKMVKNTISLNGSKIDEWYSEFNKKGAKLKKLHEYIVGEEIYYLKVNLKEENGYSVKAVIPGGGPKIDEDKVMQIPLENVSGDFIEITLNPPAGYWKFEQVGMIFEYESVPDEDITELNSALASDRNGTDIREELSIRDKNYHLMPEIGNAFDLQFDAPENFNRKTCEVFLKTSGWYEINTDKSKSPQSALLDELMNTPGKIVEYSLQLFRQNMESLARTNNKKNN
ncbi:MAG: hypothetical protein HY959_00515 [Ignavibacteriae bacterium]|nr:hypothetical protein [Ignavibacteriota bacterium]